MQYNPKIYQFNIYMLRDESKEILKLFVFIMKPLSFNMVYSIHHTMF